MDAVRERPWMAKSVPAKEKREANKGERINLRLTALILCTAKNPGPIPYANRV